MNISQKTIIALRLTLGWMFLYAGLAKLLNPSWSAAGFLNNAKTFPSIYQWFASPGILPIINIINEWALFLLGVSLLFGVFVRLSSSLGIVLMVLYYLPQLNFPYVGKNYLLIDEHVIFVLGLLILIQAGAGRIWGLDAWCVKLPICKKYPRIRAFFG